MKEYAELIKALRWCGSEAERHEMCVDEPYRCPYQTIHKTNGMCIDRMMIDAADALEAADEKIADYTAAIEALDDSNDAYIKENERLEKKIAELEKSYSWKAYAALEESIEGYKTRIAELEAQLPKEGEWIEDDTTYCGAYLSNYKCSLCGKIGGTWGRGLKQDELPPFCGSCGARMRTVTDCHTLEER